MSADLPDRPPRETRLLALVVIVAIVVLVLLSRLRFPPTALTSVPATGPLAGLAARATFDDMAAALSGLLIRVEPTLVAIELPAPAPPTAAAAFAPGRPGSPPPAAGTDTRPDLLFSALRVRRDLAVVYAGGGARPLLTPGSQGSLEVMSVDADRELAILRLTPSNDVANMTGIDGTFPGFSYVAVIEATRTGPTVRPRFIGRVSPVMDPRWSAPLLAIGEPTDIEPGAWLFRLDGAVIGLAVRGQDGITIAPASALEALTHAVPGGES